MKIPDSKLKSIFLCIFLFELISLSGFIFPDIRQISFLIIILLFLIISLKDLRFGILILLIELFIGSKGYLFYFENDGLIISIRIAFWLIILSVWFAKSLIDFVKTRTCPLKPIFKMRYFKYLAILFLFIAWAVINGILKGNDLNNIFFDFNNWLYFVLILPIFSAIKTKDDFKLIWQVFLVSIVWLSFKTFILLFFFSHNIPSTIEILYKWIRTTGVGEITLVQGGFYRIFFQSHIYNLIAFFIFLILTTSVIARRSEATTWQSRLDRAEHGIATPSARNDNFIIYYLLLIVNLSIILLSFSRSFWAGLCAGLAGFFVYVLWQYNWKLLFKALGVVITTGILSFVLMIGILNFPYPEPPGGFSATSLLKNRASQLSGEVAISSRWNLLPELWEKIKTAPIMGQGLGATVTYISNDPRIREQSPEGKYTTYAFEWGWLDIWLKFGLLGALAYIALLLKIIWNGFKIFLNNRENIFELSLVIGIIALCVVHFFTPYLNHPLGIGFIILSLVYFNKKLA